MGFLKPHDVRIKLVEGSGASPAAERPGVRHLQHPARADIEARRPQRPGVAARHLLLHP